MIVIRVELHSARTGKIKEIARARISRIYSRDTLAHDYEAIILRAPTFKLHTRSAIVVKHKALDHPVWTLICSALNLMGYGAPYARQRAKEKHNDVAKD